jgi:hypothetical protein
MIVMEKINKCCNADEILKFVQNSIIMTLAIEVSSVKLENSGRGKFLNLYI